MKAGNREGTTEVFAVLALPAELFVAFDGPAHLRWAYLLEFCQQLPGVIARDMIVLPFASLIAAGRYNDYREIGMDFLQTRDELCAGNPADLAIEHNAIHGWKAGESFDRLFSAVSGNYVHLSGLNHQLTGGDALGIFVVHNKETRSHNTLFDEIAESRGF